VTTKLGTPTSQKLHHLIGHYPLYHEKTKNLYPQFSSNSTMKQKMIDGLPIVPAHATPVHHYYVPLRLSKVWILSKTIVQTKKTTFVDLIFPYTLPKERKTNRGRSI
jgi:hypothetical protein